MDNKRLYRHVSHMVSEFEPLKQLIPPGKDGYLHAIATMMVMVNDFAEKWQAHPEYEYVQAHAPGSSENPYCLMALSPQEIIPGHHFSYVIGPIFDLTVPQMYRWAVRTLGPFSHFAPIREEIVIDNPYRIGWISYKPSLGYWNRERLKALLPKKYRKVINAVRNYYRKPKVHYLQEWVFDHGGGVVTARDIEENPDLVPKEIRKLTKLELLTLTSPELVDGIDEYMDPTAFIKACWGKLPYGEVDKYAKNPDRLLVQGTFL